jgi:hypothetical protein
MRELIAEYRHSLKSHMFHDVCCGFFLSAYETYRNISSFSLSQLQISCFMQIYMHDMCKEIK